jgi:hypothetical protein
MIKTLGHPLGIGCSTESNHSVLLVIQPQVFERVMFGTAIFGRVVFERGNIPHQKSP